MNTARQGLTNSEGCRRKPPSGSHRRAPFSSAPMMSVSASRAMLSTVPAGTDALYPGAREQRHAEHHDQRHRKKEKLLTGEVEGIEADPLGCGRARGQGQGCADQHEQQHRRQHPAVDGPPPAAEQAGVGAGEGRHRVHGGASSAAAS